MKRAVLTALAALLALAAPAALAANTLTWIAPTQRTDGSALAASEIAKYRITWTLDGVAQTNIEVAGTLLTYTHSVTALAKYCYTMYTIDTAGRVSPASATACKDTGVKPKAATGVTVA